MNLLKRFFAAIDIHCLESELKAQNRAVEHVTDWPTLRAVCDARNATRIKLLQARIRYNSTLPPGQRKTWRMA